MIQRTANGSILRENKFGLPTSAFSSDRAIDSVQATSSTSENIDPSRGMWLERVVFLLIAGLLFFTAIAKVWMLLTDRFADVRVGIGRELLWMTVLFEFVLAGLNLRLSNRSLLSFINVVTFAVFAIFATGRWLLGYGSCGCTGKIEIPAVVFIAIDWAIVAWFVSGGFGIVNDPRQGFKSMFEEFNRWWLAQSIDARQRWIGFGAFVIGLGILQLPIAQPVWTSVMSKPAIVALVTIDGELVLNKTQTGVVTLKNRSNQPASVIGMDRSCRCFELVDDPIGLVIPAQQQVTLPIVIKPNKVGHINQRIVLFVGHSNQFRVPINLSEFSKGEE